MSDKNSYKFVALNIGSAGIAAMSASSCTHPLDVVKTRMQIIEGGSKVGMFTIAQNMLKDEGAKSFYKGIQACWLRESVYSSMRLGLQEPIRNIMVGDTPKDKISFLMKLMSGSMSGLIGSFFGNPFDVLRTRMMAAKGSQVGVMECAREVYQQQGVAGFYRGVTATMGRAAVNNGVKMATQDEIKQTLKKQLGTGVLTQIICAGTASFCQAVSIAPLDMARTRLMNQPKDAKIQNGLADCLMKVASKEGPIALQKGFIPMWMRLAPTGVLQLVFWEQLRLMVGLKAL